MEDKGEPCQRPCIHHRHSPSHPRCCEAGETVGKDVVLAHWKARRPDPLSCRWLECPHRRLSRCTGVATHRTHGSALPHDVLSGRQLLPLRHRLAGAQLRAHRGVGAWYLLPRPARRKMDARYGGAPAECCTSDRIGALLLSLALLHRRREGHLPTGTAFRRHASSRATHDVGTTSCTYRPYAIVALRQDIELERSRRPQRSTVSSLQRLCLGRLSC